MKMGGHLLLENKRRMDPRVSIKKKRTKESMAEMKVQWDSSVAPRTSKIEKRDNLRGNHNNISKSSIFTIYSNFLLSTSFIFTI
jgi:hypothetical protein